MDFQSQCLQSINKEIAEIRKSIQNDSTTKKRITVTVLYDDYLAELDQKFRSGLSKGFDDAVILIGKFKQTGLSMAEFIEKGHFGDNRYYPLFTAMNTRKGEYIGDD